MRLDIRYVTRFDYGAPVVESQNELRACPASDEHQQVVHYRVTTVPASRVSSHVDYWGTRVDTFGVTGPHDRLEVVAAATVETSARPEPSTDVPLIALEDGAWRDVHLEFLQRSPHVAWGDAVVERARAAAAGGASDVRGLIEAVEHEVSGLEYRRGRTKVGVQVEEVLSAGAGVCQDFAHLTIAMLRVLGVPARYVSGYFFTADDRTGAEGGEDVEVETHAWVEAAVPGFGWWAIDPTNRSAVGERHVTIGRGRDYDDVAPLRGVFSGAPEHQLTVNVRMRRLALQPIGTPGAPGLFPAVDASSGLPRRPTGAAGFPSVDG